MGNVQDQIGGNKRNSVLLAIIVGVVLVTLAYVIGSIYNPDMIFFFIIFALGLSTVMTVGSYYYSDRIVLKTVKAEPATKKEYRYLVNTVEALSIAAGIPAPRTYVIKSHALNAFATGRDPEHGVVCVTTGLMEKLNRQELEGVLAHELSHIKNYDIRFASLIAVMVGLVAIISQFFLYSLWFSSHGGRGRGNAAFFVLGILLAILAPIVTTIIQLAISRQREFLADSSGAYITRYPEGLAKALEKIKSSTAKPIKVNKAISHLFFTNPFKKLNASGLFATHPPIDERIEKLRKM